MDQDQRYKSRSTLLRLLRSIRTEAGLPQQELAARLGRPQSYVSKYETGERRLDVLELREVCRACGVRLPDFAARLEQAFDTEPPEK